MKLKPLTLLATAAALLFGGCATEVGTFEDEGFDTDADAEVAESAEALIAASDRLPLVTFYNAARGDYFTTSQPLWTCKLLAPTSSGCTSRLDGYTIVGLQGYVYRPDLPRPAGTVPLYHWWSPSRADNFITSDPGWAGSVGDTRLDHDGYRLFRIEGYVPTTLSTSATVELRSFWNPATADNAAVVERPGYGMPAGWSFFRREGFLLGPNSRNGARCMSGVAPADRPDIPWTALGNAISTWEEPSALLDGHTLRITANGQTRIDFWGTHKNVAGEGPAPVGFPAVGEPAYSLIGQFTAGRVWVPFRGSYEAKHWFPIGAQTGCLEYDAESAVVPGDLQVMINDNNIGDNAGGPTVTVRRWVARPL